MKFTCFDSGGSFFRKHHVYLDLPVKAAEEFDSRFRKRNEESTASLAPGSGRRGSGMRCFERGK